MGRHLVLICVAVGVTATLALAVAGPARADYTNAWYCTNWPRSSYCWDPTPGSQGGAWHNWTRGEVQNLSYMWGYQCLAISDTSGYWGAHDCATYTVYEGGTFYWEWCDAYKSHWPIAGAASQTMLNSFSSFWVAFSGSSCP